MTDRPHANMTPDELKDELYWAAQMAATKSVVSDPEKRKHWTERLASLRAESAARAAG